MESRLGGEIRRHLLVGLFYLTIAVLITWPLVTGLSTRLVGWSYGDSHEMARHIWWYNHALRTGQSIFWQPALGYPDGMEGVLLWAHPQQFFPAWLLAFVLPIPAAANLSILLYMAFNGWAMYVLAGHLLGGRRSPALLAGLAFMAAPTFQGHLGGGHAGLMVAWPFPLYVYALLQMEGAAHKRGTKDIMKALTPNPSPSWRGVLKAFLFPFALREKGAGDEGYVDISPRHSARIKWFLLAVLMFVLGPGGHILQLIYVLLPISAAWALRQLWRRDWAGLLRLIAVTLLGGALLLIFVLPIARSTFDTPAYTEEGGFVRYSADLLSVVSPSFFNPLYAGLDYPQHVLGTNLEEGVSYVGLIGGGLALLALLRVKKTRWWGLLALIAWGLSLGPLLKVLDMPVQAQPDGYATFITLPWAALQNLPLFSLARTPGRFNFALALAVAALVGYGANWLWDRLPDRRLRAGVIGLLMAALLVDYQVYWPLPTHAAAIPDAVYALAQRDDVRAVLDLPWENPVADKDGLYLQIAHQKPLVAGHVTRGTPVSPAKLTLLERTLDPALLKAAGADLVIWHKAYASDEQMAFARDQLGEPLYEDADIALFNTPEADSPPQFTALLTDQAQIERSADSYLFAPDAGWVDFRGTLVAEGREVELSVDQQVIHRWRVEGEQPFAVPLPVDAGAYHVVRLAVSPPCPLDYAATLDCRAVALERPRFGDLITANPALVNFERGLRLLRATTPGQAAPGDALAVRLWWAFDAARDENDIRFVHVVNAAGESVAQSDTTLGVQPAGAQWAEQVTLDLPDDLPAGTYRVYTGWYTYPDITRFAIQSDIEGAPDGWALIGRVAVR